MKLTTFFVLLVLGACSKLEQSTSGIEIDYERETTPVAVTTTIKNKVKAICDALDDREPDLADIAGETYTFDYITKPCTDETVPTEGEEVPVIVYLNSGDSSYRFQKTDDNTDFYFSKLETSSDGSMEDLCPGTTLTNSPILSGSNYTFFTTENISASDCPPVADEQCIYFEYGVASTKEGYAKITSREWARYRLTSSTSGRVGFFTFKRKVVKSDCGEGDAVVRQATLLSN